jgi:phthiocerol/phenolphthiocerol synthesis type-I polyketide synthase E
LKTQEERDQVEGIAIIGLSGRFPGAPSIDKFWQNLRDGVESITTFTDAQLLSAGEDPALLNSPGYVKAGAVLEGVDLFDADFFGFTPREAETTDPQHRIFLECAWEALENAGYDSDRFAGRIGVFAGAGTRGFYHHLLMSNRDLMRLLGDVQTFIALEKDFLATRVSYKLNLKGPSISVQTACSTSLVAVHLGCQSLLNGESDMVLAGGVTIRIPQIKGYLYQEGSIHSPDGHCRAFDAMAQGCVFGSGVGIVVLKRLADAFSDGDCIRAVIIGSCINNDGAAKIGYTAPSVDGQAAVIAEAQAMAGVTGNEVTYVETHGTATSLGDPIEIAALTKAFRRTTQNTSFCAIGSVKTNVGHLDAAAGVASLIKVVLAVENRTLPPSLNFKQPNPAIDFANSPFYVQQSLSAWQPSNGRRIAGVSSFGIGGTNAHVVVEEAPPTAASAQLRSCHLLAISAKTRTALEKATDNLVGFFKRNPAANLANVGFTLQTGRKVFAHRRILLVEDIEEAIQLLQSRNPQRVFTASQERSDCPVAFMFPGQAAQYVNMGLEFYLTEKSFREKIDFCSEFLRPGLGFDLRQVLYPPAEKAAEASEQLKRTAVTQPAMFVIEYALAKLWMEWGLSPEVMVGHSLGEYVAACLAGVFLLEDALTLVAARGRLMQSMPRGSMLAVRLDEKSIRQYLSQELSVAVINNPSVCVVAGPTDVIEGLQALLTERQISCRLLQTSHAFHSGMMQPIVGPFRELFRGIKLSPPKIPYLSNLTGTWIVPTQAMDPGYWASHLRQTVRFVDGITELLKKPNRILLEVGPGQTLASLARQHPGRTSDHVVLSSFGRAKDKTSELAEMRTTLGQLWIAGARLDWPAFYAGQQRHRVPLPTYPFERRRYWIGARDITARAQSLGGSEPESLNAESIAPSSPAEAGRTDLSVSGHERPGLSYSDVARQDDLKKELATIWQDLLGINRVNGDDNFFDLGGDSLIAVNLSAEVARHFGKRLPLAALIGAPTLRQQADLLHERIRESAWSSLVAIEAGGSKPPLFLVHGAEGNVLLYRRLARYLGPDQPVYGLQSQGLSGDGCFYTSIEEMASHYVKELITVQPNGPYYLGGYCLGGTVALEMAQQLSAQGQKVGLVILMDTYNYSLVPRSKLRRWALLHSLQNVWFHGANFFSIRTKHPWKFVNEKWDVAKARLGISLRAWYDNLQGRGGPKAQNRYPHLLLKKINDQAMLQYVPRPYSGRVAVIRPKGYFWGLNDPSLGWRDVICEGLDVREIPVYKKGILVEPFVHILAETLKGCLREAQGAMY